MMSRICEKQFCMRWSDPILHNRHSFYCSPASEEEISSVQQSRSSSPLLSVKCHRISAKEDSSRHCLCHGQCRRKESSKFQRTRDIKNVNCSNCQQSQGMRESLELHLTGTEVEESLAEDRQSTELQRLDLTINTLEALAHYSKSLQVSELAACRVLNVSHFVACPHPSSADYSNPDSMNFITYIQQLEIQKDSRLIVLQDVIDHCTRHVIIPKQLRALMDDHCMRRRDFYVAVKNFKNLLDNSKLSVSQMGKLHRQYDTILKNYQQSRRTLTSELPKAINTRLMVLQEGFKKVRAFHENTDNINQIVTLFKLIGEKLYQDNTNIARIQVSYDRESPNSDLCRKCCLNRVDKK